MQTPNIHVSHMYVKTNRNICIYLCLYLRGFAVSHTDLQLAAFEQLHVGLVNDTILSRKLMHLMVTRFLKRGLSRRHLDRLNH